MTAIGEIDGSALRVGSASAAAAESEETTDVRAALRTGVVGVLVLSAIFVSLGLAIKGPLHASVGHWDAVVANWFLQQRSADRTWWSAAATWLAETPTVVGIGILTSLVLASRRHWHSLALVVGALLVEISIYLITVLSVARPRPAHGLEHRVTGSYPSGHVAAAIVLYGLLAFLFSRRARSPIVRGLLFVIAAAVPLVVGASRLYREMHHFSDVVAGALIGVGALVVAGLLARHVVDPPAHSRNEREIAREGVAT